jgi:hypothetical protein
MAVNVMIISLRYQMTIEVLSTEKGIHFLNIRNNFPQLTIGGKHAII